VDILTERGQQYQLYAEEAARLFNGTQGKTHSVFLTNWRKPIPVDGMMVSHANQRVSGVVEIKCREMGLGVFRSRFNNEWLITNQKLVEAQRIAQGFSVPLYGFLYLIHDGTLLVQRLTDDDGQFFNVLRTEKTKTQATCNGGEAERVNAFINMTNARVIKNDATR
jgi:hypothetical protein